MTLFRDQYRVESARLAGFDYSSPGYYFITLCTQDRLHLFGSISQGEMELNDFGEIVAEEWCKSFEIRRELEPDEYVIMPNHVHGIVHIVEVPGSEQSRNIPVIVEDEAYVREVKPGLTPKSVSSFVAGVKSVITKRINILRATPREPVWQPRFYDRIIYGDAALYNTRKYIRDNPKKWMCDTMSSDISESFDQCAISIRVDRYGDE